MNSPRILVVDDDRKLCDLIDEYLSLHNFKVTLRHNGQEGLDAAREGHFDAIILDQMMPEMNGLDMLRQLREDHVTPVLMLTSLGEEADRIMGLEMGADDYLPKTFSTRELLARLRAVIRRSQTVKALAESKSEILHAGSLTLNEPKHEAILNGDLLDLTPLEFAILHTLMKSNGRVKSREHLIEEISERRFDVFDRSIDVHVSQLRKKIQDNPRDPTFIRTVRAVGYQFIHPVTDNLTPES